MLIHKKPEVRRAHMNIHALAHSHICATLLYWFVLEMPSNLYSSDSDSSLPNTFGHLNCHTLTPMTDVFLDLVF